MITFRIGFPVWPFQSPERSRGERRNPIKHLMHLLDAVLPVIDVPISVLRHPQRDVEDRAVLGDVDVLTAEHRVPALGDPTLVGELRQELQRLLSVTRFFE